MRENAFSRLVTVFATKAQEQRGRHSTRESVDIVRQLKACAKQKDLQEGQRVHASLLNRGLLNCYTASALVNMYSKCAAFAKAASVLNELPVCNVASWNALISGYAQQGQEVEALFCFKRMLEQVFSPNAVTFISVLKACGRLGAINIGEQIHDVIVKQDFLGKKIVLANALVDMYVKCGAIGKAATVLRELPFRNVVTWNILIAGYAEQGQGDEAMKCFTWMQCEGLSPDSVTFLNILKACRNAKAAHNGEQIHLEILKLNLLAKDIVLGTSLVDMYAKCGMLSKAKQVLDEFPVLDVVAWNALLNGYVQQEQDEAAFECFDQMQSKGISPNLVTFTSILKACASTAALHKGMIIHEEIASQELLGKDVILGTALVDMYVKCGALAKAAEVLDELCVRDVASWNTLIAGYVHQGHGEEALKFFEQMQCEGVPPNSITFASMLRVCGSTGLIDKGEKFHEDIASHGVHMDDAVLGNSLVDMYAKCGAMSKAAGVLGELPVRDVVSWSTLILGFAQQGQGQEALYCFDQMQREGFFPDTVALICILKACSSVKAADKGGQIHNEIARQALLGQDTRLGNALLDMYIKCGSLVKAVKLLDELPVRDTISWSVLIAGFAEHESCEEALFCFEQMQEEGLSPNTVTFIGILKACGSIRAAEKGEWIHEQIVILGFHEKCTELMNTVVDMYAKCGAFAKAAKVLDTFTIQDVVPWNAMIAGHAQQGEGKEALKCYERMLDKGLCPDSITFISILKACGSMGAADKGKQIHNEIVKSELLTKDVVLGNALVAMYAKCGALAKAAEVLHELPVRDVGSWNALISGYSQYGQIEEALVCFKWMEFEGLIPDAVTLVCLHSACGRSGLLDKGTTFLTSVTAKYELERNTEYYTCMAYLFARLGEFDKALAVISKMPSSTHLPVWRGLLGACQECGNVALARLAFSNAVQIDKTNSAAYVLMHKICVSAMQDGNNVDEEVFGEVIYG